MPIEYGIEISTRSLNRFNTLEPKLAEQFGLGVRPIGSEMTVYQPNENVLPQIIKKLKEHRIPFRPRYFIVQRR